MYFTTSLAIFIIANIPIWPRIKFNLNPTSRVVTIVTPAIQIKPKISYKETESIFDLCPIFKTLSIANFTYFSAPRTWARVKLASRF
jgi:hypothetical protein